MTKKPYPYRPPPATRRPERPLDCSFCGKNERVVAIMIRGPVVQICDECIALCNELVAELNADKERKGNASVTVGGKA